jgi:large subunit ribosomal protein L29
MAEAKKKNYASFTDEDLRKELDALVKGLFNLRVRKVTDVVENPASFRKHRREIARIKTVQRQREIAKAAKAPKAPAKAPEKAPAKPAPAAPKTK